MADLRRKSLGRPLLYALVLVGIYLAYLILRPFFVPLTWAVIFAILFARMQAALARRMKPGRAAGLTTTVVGLAIVAPAVVLVAALAREGPGLLEHAKETSRSAPQQVQTIWAAIRAHSPMEIPEDPMQAITEGARRLTTFLTSHAGAFVGNLFGTLGNVVAMLFALFFLLRDGDALRRQLRDRLPFPQEESERLINETRDLVIASVGAGAVVAVAQGFLGGLAFRLVGIDAPVLWGVVMGFASLLPVVGATLIWIPAAIGLLLSGAIGRGVALLLMGLFGISMADNVLRPILLTGKTSISGFVIFFGLLGGAAAFGLLGLVIGPIVLVITARLLETLHRPDLVDQSSPEADVVAAKAS